VPFLKVLQGYVGKLVLAECKVSQACQSRQIREISLLQLGIADVNCQHNAATAYPSPWRKRGAESGAVHC